MATTGERAAIGAEEARLEGRGPVGEAVEGAEMAEAGRTGRRARRGDRLPGHRSRSRSLSDGEGGLGRRHRHHHGGLGEGVRTIVSNEGEAYCPNPNIRDLVSNA
jgi:hypothetical protein